MGIIESAKGVLRAQFPNLPRWVARCRGKTVLHFIHIGKTGGTAIKHALSSIKFSDYWITVHHHNFTLQDVPPEDKCFFFVRDPITRFTSGFYSRQREGQPRHYTPWSPEEAAAFNRFESPNQLAKALGDENAATRRDAYRAMNDIRHVRDSYTRWFGSLRQLKESLPDILFVGSQEHLKADVTRLTQKILKYEKDLALPSDPKEAHKNPSDLSYSLDSEAKKNLRLWYSQDFQLLDLLRNKFKGLPCYSDRGT